MVWAETAVFRADQEIIEELGAFVKANPSWIIEGCYGRWMEHLLPLATELVFMNPGEATCVSNCLARPWEAHKYSSQAEQDAKLPFLLDWVRKYYSRSDEISLQAHRRQFDSYEGKKTEVTVNGPED